LPARAFTQYQQFYRGCLDISFIPPLLVSFHHSSGAYFIETLFREILFADTHYG
jgi:hypothetical protein